MRNRIAVAVAVAALAAPTLARAQGWDVISPPEFPPTAVGCSQPDVLGNSLCIAVDQTRTGPRVWLFGDHDALWDTVTVSVDDGEIFVALRPHDPSPEWSAAEGARLIQALQTGSQAFVSTGIDNEFVALDGARRVIGDVLARAEWEPIR